MTFELSPIHECKSISDTHSKKWPKLMSLTVTILISKVTTLKNESRNSLTTCSCEYPTFPYCTWWQNNIPNKASKSSFFVHPKTSVWMRLSSFVKRRASKRTVVNLLRIANGIGPCTERAVVTWLWWFWLYVTRVDEWWKTDNYWSLT